MFLIDTNCWIQLARERSEADSVRQLIGGIPLTRFFVTIYSVHSIGIIFHRRGMIDRYPAFLDALSIGRGIQIVDVPVAELSRVGEAIQSHGLDFDDAYQYVVAETRGLRLVSLDADFDRTPNGRLTPAAALQQFKDEQQKQSKDA